MNFQSETINELAISLSKAQAKIKVAIEDKKNPHFKSSYASLNSIWDACREAITNEGLSVVQTTEPEENCLYLVTTLMHSSGQWIKSKLPISSTAISPQQLGSCITYFRRYSLASIVGVAPGEEDDAQTIENESIELKKKHDITFKSQQIKKTSSVEDINLFKKKFKIGEQSNYEIYLSAIADKCKKSLEEMVISACLNETGFIESFDKWSEKNKIGGENVAINTPEI